jgi:hypothetical protein
MEKENVSLIRLAKYLRLHPETVKRYFKGKYYTVRQKTHKGGESSVAVISMVELRNYLHSIGIYDVPEVLK